MNTPISVLKRLVRQALPASLQHRITQSRLAKSINHYPSRIVSHQYGPHRLKVNIRDNLAAGWYDHDWEQPPEIGFLKVGRLRDGALVFDLGAHQGVVAMILAREVGTSGRVVAVEGTYHNVEAAHANAALNEITNIAVIHSLVADRPGELIPFSNTLNGSVSTSGAGDAVPTVSIDSLAADHGPPDVVFLDVEGFESHALRGATETLKGATDFFVEVHAGCGLDQHGTPEEVLAFFDPNRFDSFIALGEGAHFRPVAAGEPLPKSKFFLIAQARSAQ